MNDARQDIVALLNGQIIYPGAYAPQMTRAQKIECRQHLIGIIIFDFTRVAFLVFEVYVSIAAPISLSTGLRRACYICFLINDGAMLLFNAFIVFNTGRQMHAVHRSLQWVHLRVPFALYALGMIKSQQNFILQERMQVRYFQALGKFYWITTYAHAAYSLALMGMLIALLVQEGFFAATKLKVDELQIVWLLHMLLVIGIPVAWFLLGLGLVVVTGVWCMLVSLFTLLAWPFFYLSALICLRDTAGVLKARVFLYADGRKQYLLRHSHARDEEAHDKNQSQVSQGTTDCAICLNQFENDEEVILFPCHRKHVFHYTCGIQWWRQRKNCPFCNRNFQYETEADFVVRGTFSRHNAAVTFSNGFVKKVCEKNITCFVQMRPRYVAFGLVRAWRFIFQITNC